MPKDVPPRPGAPGYEEFMAHQSHQDVAPNAAPNTAAAPGTTAVVAPTGAAPGAPGTTAVVAVPVATAPGTTAAVPPPAGRYARPPPQAPLPPAYARPDDRSPTQGGLY